MFFETHLSGVDFEVAAGDLELEVLVFRRVEILEHVLRGEGVDAVLGVLRLAVELAAHRVGLARPGLPVGEARGHAALENVVHERLGRISEKEILLYRENGHGFGFTANL